MAMPTNKEWDERMVYWQIVLSLPTRGRGPRRKAPLDYRAIKFMTEADDGRVSIRKLAEMAVDKGLAAKRGGRDAKVQRLERLYAKWRKRRACK